MGLGSWRTVVVAVALVAFAGCGGADQSGELPPEPPAAKQPPAGSQFGRNVVRVPGLSPADVAGAALLTSFAPERGAQPSGIVLTQDTAWRELVLAAQFAAAPVNAAILPMKDNYLPMASRDVLKRLEPTGFKKAKGLQVMIFGRADDEVVADLQNRDLKLTQFKDREPAELSAELVPYRGGFAGRYSSSIVVASSEARAYALPAAAWSAFSGDTIAFVGRARVPASTRKLLAQREKLRLEKPTIYVVGPRSVVSNRVVRQLSRYGTVKRIAGATPAATSVAFARYRDPKTGFGWGVRSAPASVSILNLRTWGNAAGALTFAARGPRAPLLLTDGADRLPSDVLRYLQQLRGGRPSQVYAFGDERSISTRTLAEVDALLASAERKVDARG